jgi:hypothetical protein
MLADGLDVFVVCVVEPGTPDSASLRVVGPNETVADTKLYLVDGYQHTDVGMGYGVRASMVDTLFVADGPGLLAVGFRWLYEGHAVSTLYIALPANRPSGSWSVQYQGNVTDSLALTSTTCGQGPVGGVWITDPAIDVYTVGEENSWWDDTDIEVTQPDHCRSGPNVLGEFLDAAASTMSSAYRSVLDNDIDVPLLLSCGADSSDRPIIVDQSPVPYADIEQSARVELTYTMRCAPMPDVFGSTIVEAKAIIMATPGLADLPSPVEFAVPDSCGDDSIVTGSSPAVGGDWYEPGETIKIVLRCA